MPNIVVIEKIHENSVITIAIVSISWVMITILIKLFMITIVIKLFMITILIKLFMITIVSKLFTITILIKLFMITILIKLFMITIVSKLFMITEMIVMVITIAHSAGNYDHHDHDGSIVKVMIAPISVLEEVIQVSSFVAGFQYCLQHQSAAGLRWRRARTGSLRKPILLGRGSSKESSCSWLDGHESTCTPVVLEGDWPWIVLAPHGRILSDDQMSQRIPSLPSSDQLIDRLIGRLFALQIVGSFSEEELSQLVQFITGQFSGHRRAS